MPIQTMPLSSKYIPINSLSTTLPLLGFPGTVMCLYLNFVYACCGQPAASQEPLLNDNICTQPCESLRDYAKSLPQNVRKRLSQYHNKRFPLFNNCEDRVTRTLIIDAICRPCQDEYDGIEPTGMYGEENTGGTERNRRFNSERIWSAVTESDPDELKTYIWHVPGWSVPHPEWFREIKWDQTGCSFSDEEPLSPKSKSAPMPATPHTLALSSLITPPATVPAEHQATIFPEPRYMTRHQKRKSMDASNIDAIEFLELDDKHRAKRQRRVLKPL